MSDNSLPSREQALELLTKYNKEEFHIRHSLTVEGVMREAAKKLGYHKHIHCHLARHTFATTCITLGISLPATSKLLGHRTVETTLIYAKFVDPFLDKEMKKFKRLG